MSIPSPPPGGQRASRGIKLVLMGVALLYSCGPSVGAGLGALPYFWFLPNPFYRPPIAGTCPPGTPNCDQATSRGSSSGGGYGGSGRSTTSDAAKSSPSESAHTSSQRGGFGSSGSTGGSSGS
jgi:hypothetical protein